MGGMKGADIEARLVNDSFKYGGLGINYPASGTYKIPEKIIPKNDIQKRCTIPISLPHIDLGYEVDNYVTGDYWAFFIDNDIMGNIKSFGNHGKYESRFVEVKTRRLRKSDLKKGETTDDINEKKYMKENAITETFNILKKEKRDTVKRGKKEIPNPYKGKQRKSDFCIELERIWYLSELSKHLFTQGINKKFEKFGIDFKMLPKYIPSEAYLQVRFIYTYTEIWIPIRDLAMYQSSNKNLPRDNTCTMLDVIKDENNIITWKWRRNKRLLSKLGIELE